MAKTSAQRKQKQREALKEKGLYGNFKKNEAMKQRQRRFALKETASLDLLSSLRKKKAEEMRKYRSKLKQQKVTVNTSAFASQSSFASKSSYGKAVARAKRNLPCSPRKCREVVQSLAKQISPHIIIHEKGKSSKQICRVTIQTIRDFYARDDISRQSPGIKDTIMVPGEDGRKVKMQKRHLYTNILETYAVFCEEFGDIIGKSKFAELRPKHILTSSQTPVNVCLCKYHQNFILAVNALAKNCNEIPTYDRNFLTRFAICDEPTTSCWYDNCLNCKAMMQSKLERSTRCIGDMAVNWFEWKDEKGRLKKVSVTGTVMMLCGHISSMTPTFKEHSYVKRNQEKAYNNDRVDCMTAECNFSLLQVDFAENYTCLSQDEIQSYHWVQPQVSIFTVSLWYHQQQHAIAIVSDNLHHNKDTVIPYIDRALKEIPSDIKEVRIWSDGPASQFKNRYIANSLPKLATRHDLKISWNFFATSHGKGPVDGIGGALKRQVRIAVMRREKNVSNAMEFVEAVDKRSKVQVILMDGADISKIYNELALHSVFDEAAAINEIKKVHKIYVNNFNFVKAVKLSCFQKTSYQEVYSDTSSDESA